MPKKRDRFGRRRDQGEIRVGNAVRKAWSRRAWRKSTKLQAPWTNSAPIRSALRRR